MSNVFATQLSRSPLLAAKAPVLALMLGCGTPAPPAHGIRGTTVQWAAANTTSFTPLCPHGYERCRAIAISADGTTVVGLAVRTEHPMDPIAVRWRAGQLEALGNGDLHAGHTEAVSADGRTIVGGMDIGDKTVGVVWIGDDPPVVLADPVGRTVSLPAAISSDGAVIVGLDFTEDDAGLVTRAAIRWRSGTPEVLREGSEMLFLTSIAVSASGGVVAGTETGRNGVSRGVRIRGAQIDRLEHGSSVEAISGDGRVMVGSNGGRAMRWRDLKAQPLGLLPGASYCEAHAVSYDGSRIVGHCTQGGSEESAFIWDDKSGMASVAAVLSPNGVAAPGTILRRALGISADGVTLVGDGKGDAWIATIPR